MFRILRTLGVLRAGDRTSQVLNSNRLLGRIEPLPALFAQPLLLPRYLFLFRRNEGGKEAALDWNWDNVGESSVCVYKIYGGIQALRLARIPYRPIYHLPLI